MGLLREGKVSCYEVQEAREGASLRPGSGLVVHFNDMIGGTIPYMILAP